MSGRLSDPAAHVEAQRRARAEQRITDREEQRRLLPVTQGAMADLGPSDWVQIGRLVHAIIARPAFAGPEWEAHRHLLGSLAIELYMEGRERGEPDPEPTREELREFEEYLARAFAEQDRRDLERARRRAFGR